MQQNGLSHPAPTETPLTAPAKPQLKHRKRYIIELKEIQGLLLNDMRNPTTTPVQRAACARAYNETLERMRLLKMQPKPRDLDVSDRLKPRPDRQPKAMPMPGTNAKPLPQP